jgi:hypothetical protein
MATAAERWRSRQTRRLARDAVALAEQTSRFAAGVDRFPGPYADDARDLTKRALDLVKLAASVDGMQEITDLMTEETR